MRLIDADNLITEILTHDLIGDDKRIDQIILDAPTVEAIPVEWIRQWATKDGFAFPNWLREMIKDWEKENENRVE